jgi:hypothetical protein
MAVRVNRVTCNDKKCDKPVDATRVAAYFDGDHIAVFHYYCAEHLDMAADPAYEEMLQEINPRLEVVVYTRDSGG